MNINSNISLKNRSVVTLSGFKGLDTLSSSVNVSAIHSTEMENLISRDGVNHKRYGWKTKLRIRDYDNENKGFFPKIQGIFEFNIFLTKFIFAYANMKFWWIDLDEGTYININNKSLFWREENKLDYEEKGEQTVAPLEEGFLKDQQCKCFQNGNKVYFVGCGDYLVFSRWENDRFEIRRVVGNEDVYIPTTTENIGWEGMANPPERITAEERNILSPYNKNTLIGPDQLEKNEKARYYLDTKDFTEVEVEIKNKNEEIIFLTKGGNSRKYKENEEINVLEIVSEPFSLEKEYPLNNIVWAELDNVSLGTFKLKEGDEELDYQIQLVFTPLSWEEDNRYNFTLNTVEYAELKVVAYKFDGTYEKDEFIIKNVRLISNLDWHNESKVHITYKANLGRFNVDLTDKHIILKNATDRPELQLFTAEYNLVCKEDSVGYIYATYNPSEGYIDFYGRGDDCFFSPQVAYKPNIVVKMKTEVVERFASNCIAREFGLQGATDRLFVVDDNNLVRWSKDEDFTYFGEKSWCACGTPDKKIISMDRLNDNTLLLVKEYSAKDHSIFAITGNLVTKQTEGNTIDYLSLFSVRGYQVGEGAVGDIVSFNGECLMVARDGFYAISLGENVAVDQRYVVHRSKQISNELSNFELREAKCVAYDGKFYACVEKNDKYYVYVADSKYLVNFENSTQYEWWKWTNIPVSVWGFVNNELWFGTNNGQVCSFTNKFYDEELICLQEGLLGYEPTENEITSFYLNEDIEIEDNDLLVFDCDMWGKVEANYEVKEGKTYYYDLALKDYMNDTHFIINNKEVEIEKSETHIVLNGTYGGTFYRNYKNVPITIKKEDEMIYLQKDGENIEWLKSECTPSNELKATLHNKKTIVARWKSGAMDLGTRVYAKTITGFSLTGEKDLANRLKYKIHHRLGREDYEHFRANNDLDLEGVDLQTISLDSNFASTYSKKLNIRNVNFVQLELEQDTREDMAINSVQLEFKLCKKNIGVR